MLQRQEARLERLEEEEREAKQKWETKAAELERAETDPNTDARTIQALTRAEARLKEVYDRATKARERQEDRVDALIANQSQAGGLDELRLSKSVIQEIQDLAQLIIQDEWDMVIPPGHGFWPSPSNDRFSAFFHRPCYTEIMNLIWGDIEQFRPDYETPQKQHYGDKCVSAVVTGNPGIGKSWFSMFALTSLLKRSHTIEVYLRFVGHDKYSSHIRFRKSEGKITVDEHPPPSSNASNAPFAVYLWDPHQDRNVTLPATCAFVIVTSSPRTDVCRPFEEGKLGGNSRIIYMPAPNYAEILEMNNWMQRTVGSSVDEMIIQQVWTVEGANLRKIFSKKRRTDEKIVDDLQLVDRSVSLKSVVTNVQRLPDVKVCHRIFSCVVTRDFKVVGYECLSKHIYRLLIMQALDLSLSDLIEIAFENHLAAPYHFEDMLMRLFAIGFGNCVLEPCSSEHRVAQNRSSLRNLALTFQSMEWYSESSHELSTPPTNQPIPTPLPQEIEGGEGHLFDVARTDQGVHTTDNFESFEIEVGRAVGQRRAIFEPMDTAYPVVDAFITFGSNEEAGGKYRLVGIQSTVGPDHEVNLSKLQEKLALINTQLTIPITMDDFLLVMVVRNMNIDSEINTDETYRRRTVKFKSIRPNEQKPDVYVMGVSKNTANRILRTWRSQCNDRFPPTGIVRVGKRKQDT
jgi:hypothetical protein